MTIPWSKMQRRRDEQQGKCCFAGGDGLRIINVLTKKSDKSWKGQDGGPQTFFKRLGGLMPLLLSYLYFYRLRHTVFVFLRFDPKKIHLRFFSSFFMFTI
jgi:hypothetical protein